MKNRILCLINLLDILNNWEHCTDILDEAVPLVILIGVTIIAIKSFTAQNDKDSYSQI